MVERQCKLIRVEKLGLLVEMGLCTALILNKDGAIHTIGDYSPTG